MSFRLRLLGVLAAPLPILVMAAVPSFASQSPAPARIPLRGAEVAAVSHSVRTGGLAADRQLSVSVSLAPRDPAALDAFVAKVSDRSSAEYGHYLTPAQFADRFGPTTAQINQVTSYLRSQGLTVGAVTGGHLVVKASGTVAQIQQAFGTQLSTYRDAAAKRDYYANATAPTLPSAIAASVVDVGGLSNYATLRHSVAYTPTQITTGYDLTSVRSAGYTGSGSVALIEFDGFKQSYITKYDTTYSISTTSPTKIAVDGGSGSIGSGEIEVELDIEVIQAIAPGAAIHVYEAPNTDAGEVDLYSAIVNADEPVTSISWGLDEPDRTSANITAVHNVLAEGAAQGESFFAASGDNGSDDAGTGGTSVDYPASDPYVTGTGGTTLKLTSANAWSSETAWSGSGGGVSVKFTKPSFQSGISGTYRSVPDVSTAANPSYGWRIYSEGAWYQVGGTSAAAPSWAAFTSIYNQRAAAAGKAALGYANPTLYTLGAAASSGFHDITSGSNGAYSAAAGYDRVTGWGSYDGAKLITALLG